MSPIPRYLYASGRLLGTAGRAMSRMVRGKTPWTPTPGQDVETAWSRALSDWRAGASVPMQGTPGQHGSRVSRGSGQSALQERPYLRAQYTGVVLAPIHAAIAGELFARRREFLGKAVHFEHASRLIAVSDLVNRRVFVRRDVADIDPFSMIAHVRPAAASTANSVDFEPVDLRSMLWHFGQTDPAAAQLVPQAVGELRLRLRKMPKLMPGLLQDRHKDLIRLLGTSAMSFEQLGRLVAEAAKPFLCADIAALYLVGSLQFAAEIPEESPTLQPASAM